MAFNKYNIILISKLPYALLLNETRLGRESLWHHSSTLYDVDISKLFFLSLPLYVSSLNLEKKDDKGRTPLWLSLTIADNKFDPDDTESVPARLHEAGASCDCVDGTTGLWC